MNIESVKHFLGRGTKVACVSLAMLVSVNTCVLEVSAADLAIQTVNLEEIQTSKVSRMVQEEEVDEHLAGVDLSKCSFSTFGNHVEEMFLEPESRVLSSTGVPDGEGICNSLNKTYMDYKTVTSITSNQYKLLNSDKAYTDPVTGLRMYEGRICIAVGTFYASTIGTKIDLVMSNGSIVKCILGDVKADIHTDETNRYHSVDGSVVEMIVDGEYFQSTQQYPKELRGRVERILVVE